ncbi:MAG: GNAT family N-acetyltransferase [Bdellovibrionota bacterium]
MLETKRLLLRGWEEKDRLEFARMNGDSQVMEYFPALWSLEESNAVFEKLRNQLLERGWGLWALEDKASGKFLGFTGLNIPGFEAPFLPAVEIGWRLLPDYWNRGFATEAALKSLSFGFEVLGLEEIVSFTAVGNVKSQRIMEKIGMIRCMEKDFLHPRVPDGHVLKAHVVYEKKRPR